MASIYRQMELDVPAAHAWAALADVGALHTRLVQGFVTDTKLEGNDRLVTFANGMTVTERVVSVDQANMRLVYTVVGGRTSHHNAAVQVHALANSKCRLVWVTDLLPDELAGPIGEMVDAGAAAMKRTLELSYRRGSDA